MMRLPAALWRSLGTGALLLPRSSGHMSLPGAAGRAKAGPQRQRCAPALQHGVALAAAGDSHKGAPILPFVTGVSTRSLSAAAASELVVAPRVDPPGVVRSLKEELWRRQKVATTFFTHPVASLQDAKPDAGSIELASAVFKQAERLDILNRVVLWQRAKKRVVARVVKTRAMTQGGGKKPWRQKGSGRARHGSIRSPIWKGGGKAHGPVPRSFAFDIPKKVRRLALRVAISARMREGKCVIIQTEALKEPKTQYLATVFQKWGWDNVLVIGGAEVEQNFKLAASNIPNCDVLPSMGANVYRCAILNLRGWIGGNVVGSRRREVGRLQQQDCPPLVRTMHLWD